MKRLIRLPDDRCGNKMNYVLQKEYEGFGLYQRKCATGFLVDQDYLITNEKIVVACPSYNHIITEELLDAIDKYNETKEFGFQAMKQDTNLYVIHPSGNYSI